MSNPASPLPSTAPPAPPSDDPTASPPSNKERKKWWLWAIVIIAIIGGLWWFLKPSKAQTRGDLTPSGEYRSQQRDATNEVAKLSRQLTELSARIATMTSSNTPITNAAPSTNAPTITGLGVIATNVSSTVVSSNIYGPINTAGGNVNYTTISYGSPSNMVTMGLMAWPSWVKSNPTNSFMAPGPRIKVGEMTTLRICKGHALEINLEDGYTLHPDVNDLQKVTMLWGDQRGCLTFDPDRQFRLPLGHVGPVRNLIWITPDSPEEAVEFRFMVVRK